MSFHTFIRVPGEFSIQQTWVYWGWREKSASIRCRLTSHHFSLGRTATGLPLP